MKKSTKTSIIAGALVVATCIGATLLVGCGEEEKFDPYSNMSPVSYAELSQYISKCDTNFPSIQITYDKTEGQIYKRYTLQKKVINNKNYAHFVIDANQISADASNPTILHIQGDTYLYDNKLYIDNGSEKYWVEYDGNGTYATVVDTKLSESQLLNKYLYTALNEMSSTPVSSFALNQTFEKIWRNSIFYTYKNENDVYYKVDCNDPNTNTHTEYKIAFNNWAITEYETFSQTTKDSHTTELRVKYQQLTDSIEPPNAADWPKKV